MVYMRMWPSSSSRTWVRPLMVISSRPSSPWTTSAWRQPSRRSTTAIFSVSDDSATPSTWAWAWAGLVSGPRMLKTVRMPISRRGAPAYFMAGWNDGANMNPMPTSDRHCSTCCALRLIFTPRASSTSALPHWLLAARLPCLATLRPAPATAKAAAVEMLKVEALSPPVPQVSTTMPSAWTGMALSRITRAMPAISSLVSPFIRSAVTKAPNCAGVTWPSMISVMADAACSMESDFPPTSAAMSSFIMPAPPSSGNCAAGPCPPAS